MASPTDESENRGTMWDLDQKLDQPMDVEAVRLKNAFREKVKVLLIFALFILKNYFISNLRVY